ncbi:gliding motility-associated C-terminal domain-containing protein [Flavobacterium ardleyense]|uniref:Gliding motility-associated C-terminal domain-containing protein n=1 Tax=Flavobacterium ardleyense TaxID=2038737 RepID=A0ABW5Z6X3_9FLAO
MYASQVSIKYLVLTIILAVSSTVSGQIQISLQQLGFQFKCQTEFINTSHTVTFSASPTSAINPGNIFSLELSNDEFATYTVITPTSITQSGANFTMTFSFPQETFGLNYKLRVRSSSPAKLSVPSVAFDAYFIPHNQEIVLNTPVGIDNVSFCSGATSFTLFIYDSGTSSSPLFYPQLTYVWKKRQTPNDIVVGTGSSLAVTQPGEYYVETNYGVCSPSFDSKSRIVTVSSQASSPLTITSSDGNQICEGTPVTLTGSLTGGGNTYKWYKDLVLITGANGSSYVTTYAGEYKLVVDNGICVSEATILLSPITFNSSVSPSNTIMIYEGQTSTIVATTTAVNPVFQWFRNGVLLTETSSSLVVSDIGTYKVVITQTLGCAASEEIEIIVKKPEIDDVPNLISPNNDGFNDTWVLPSAITSQSDINIKIFNSSGKMVLSTNNYLNDWPTEESDYKNSNAVFYYILSKGGDKIKQGTITVIK